MSDPVPRNPCECRWENAGGRLVLHQCDLHREAALNAPTPSDPVPGNEDLALRIERERQEAVHDRDRLYGLLSEAVALLGQLHGDALEAGLADWNGHYQRQIEGIRLAAGLDETGP